MPHPRVTLDQWNALVAVVETGSYARAAEQLSRSQSSISYAVQQIQSLLGVQAFAVNAEEYTALPYQNYCYLGDSISWGYGLDPNMDNHNKFSIGTRVTGSFTDIIASVLEQNNSAVVHPAASAGSRLCD